MLRLSLRECIRQLRPVFPGLDEAGDEPSGGENQAADSGLQLFHCTSFCTKWPRFIVLELMTALIQVCPALLVSRVVAR